MDYQVWTKDEYGDTWSREEAGDLEAAKRIILAARQQGKEVALTVEVPFELQIKVGEPGGESKQKVKKVDPIGDTARRKEVKSEADKNKAEPDKNTEG